MREQGGEQVSELQILSEAKKVVFSDELAAAVQASTAPFTSDSDLY